MLAPVSVVIPSFNRADLIAETIDAVRAQSLPPAEIIVVDDGSTDATAEVLAAFGPAIQCISVSNGGAPRARNIGVAAATQPWIALCDSDDLWRPDFLLQAFDLIALSPETTTVFANFSLIDGSLWRNDDKFATAPSGWWEGIALNALCNGMLVAREALYPHILRFQPIFPSALMMTRRRFNAIGGFDAALGRIKSEDLEFVLRCVAEPGVGILTQPLVGIRKHGGNFSGDALKTTLGEIEILRFALKGHAIPDDWRQILRDEIVRRSINALDGAFAVADMALVRSLAGDAKGRDLTFRQQAKK